MDQTAIGRFIAGVRKEQGLTQRQLADALNISDKTVSKWECGNGMPEVSLIMPLCEALGVNVNELFSAQKLSDADYHRKAEENIMDLVKEREESKKKLVLSIVVGSICIVAVLALVLLAAFLDIPVVARVLLIVFALAIAIAGIGAAAVLDREAGTFECPNCHARFVPSMKEYTKGIHTFVKRRLTCPECGQTSMCIHRITK